MPTASQTISLTLLLALASPGLRAQDVESFWSGIRERLDGGDILRASGSIRLDAALNAFSSADGARRRNAPFTWGASAGAQFDLLGIRAPFFLAYANRNTRYELPSYTFAGLSPSYRWVTLHAGDRSMTFSPYSLSGVNFRGGGVELRPGNWTIAAMRGRLRTESAEFAGANQSGLLLDLRRTGQGLRLGYGTDASAVEASVFHSRDRLAAGADTLARANAPEANLVLTIGGRHQLSKAIAVEVEYARSALTRDTEAAPLDGSATARTLLGLHAANVTTASADAFRGELKFSPSFGAFGFAYERVGPEYKTHGALFIQSDFENVTASAAVPLLARRLNVSARGGLQRNDLRDVRAAQLRRVIGSAQAQYRWSDRVQTTLGVSNFNTTNRLRVVDLSRPAVDSVVLAQAQLSVNATASWIVDAAATQSLVATATAQRARLIRDDEVDAERDAGFQLVSVQYARRVPDAPWGFNAGVVYNRNRTAAATVTTVGPVLAAQVRLLDERLEGSASLNYNARYVETDAGADAQATALVNAGAEASYGLTEKQRVRLSGTLVRAGGAPGQPGFTDAQLQLAYNLSF